MTASWYNGPMRTVELIQKKRSGGILASSELAFLVNGYVDGQIPDYQMSALLMAIFFKGMSPDETVALTRIMIESGATLPTERVPGVKVDKHSTGGVGDKTSLILAPIVAAAGQKVPMMSGRGLGHTGGTLDKLETIPGYRVMLGVEEALQAMSRCGYVMMGQTSEMVPADRLLYALRDASGTVESIPLITASILSKKKAEGTDALLLDVKTGSGAFMQSLDDARSLARSLVSVGAGLGMDVQAIITDMDAPLGTMIGNFLEVEECWRLMAGDRSLGFLELTEQGFMPHGPAGKLLFLSVESASRMLVLGKKCPSLREARELSLAILESGRGLDAWKANIREQGGRIGDLESRISTWRAPIVQVLQAETNGYIGTMDAKEYGLAAVGLGAGRNIASDSVQPHVGIELLVQPGQEVKRHDPIVRIYGVDEKAVILASDRLRRATAIVPSKPIEKQLIIEEVVPA